jgi:hypothetical protein
LYTINHISEKWNNDTKGIIYLIEEFDWFKTCNEYNLNKTTHALDKLYIRMMAFYGNTYETSPRENGFYLFEAGKISNVFYPLFQLFKLCFVLEEVKR